MATTRWNIDTTHSGIHFSVRHMVISKVRGQFSRWQGVLDLDPEDLASSSVQVKIETASIDTGVEQRDTHLRSPDFFDAERFPELTFVSKSVEADGSDLRITGDLTIHGVTREVVLDAEYSGQLRDPYGLQRAGFTARTTINRTDFGLSWNALLETGGLVVGEKVAIEIELEATAAAVAAKAA